MGIGAVYHGQVLRDTLVAVAAESACLSHHSFSGCASAVVSAAGCALACEQVPVEKWPEIIVHDFLPRVERYLLGRPPSRRPAVDEVSRQSQRFAQPWLSHIHDPRTRMTLQQISDPEQRDQFFASLGGGWDGVSAVYIAFEALRLAQGSWEKLVHFGGAHGGDSDSTLAIAGAWFGAAYGLGRTPPSQWRAVEKLQEMCQMAEALEQIRSDLQRAVAAPPASGGKAAPAAEVGGVAYRKPDASYMLSAELPRLAPAGASELRASAGRLFHLRG